jgi:hypothetical protein
MVSAVALFCQDIREEKAETVTLVGIFPDNISVASIPFTFPKLAIYARILFPVSDEPPATVALRLVRPDGTETAMANFATDFIRKGREQAVAKGGVNAGLIGTAIMAVFPITQAGRMDVIAKIDGNDLVCGTLNVHVDAA